MRNPRILQEFEQRLEGAVEGFFARAFRSGLQPVELAKGVKRYAEQQRQVAADAVVVPNAYRFRVHPKDHGRLAGFGPRLAAELAAVVEETAHDEAWALAGPVTIEVVSDDQVAYGMFRLVGRVDAEAQPMPAVPGAEPAPVAPRAAPSTTRTANPKAAADTDHTDGTDVDMTAAFGDADAPSGELGLILPGGRVITLTGARQVAGRVDADIVVDHLTVSRAHAAFVRRGDGWWVLDLNSTNGTRVNDRSAAEQPIRHGDRVELGEAVVEVVER